MSTENDKMFMKIALDHAHVALANGFIPVGAIFVKDGRIIGHGVKNGTVHALFDHAEHNGCYESLWSRNGPKNLRGTTVYTTLEPCLMFLTVMMTARVSRIVYALEDPYGGGTLILDIPNRLPERFIRDQPVIERGPLREESRLLLREFFLTPTNNEFWKDVNNPLVALCTLG